MPIKVRVGVGRGSLDFEGGGGEVLIYLCGRGDFSEKGPPYGGTEAL